MKNILFIIFMSLSIVANAQFDIEKFCKQTFKFSTFYAAINGGTSLSDQDVFSITTGALEQSSVETPYDYSASIGIRKIARFKYENKANTFYDGTEISYGDAATVGKVSGLEFLFETNYKRQFGNDYIDQNHFLRYVADSFIVKVEYLQDGFADIEYFEASERYRYIHNKKLSFNVGAVQRMAEPYGYDPLEDWILSNGNLHYTYLAIQEGYTIDVYNSEYKDPDGNIVATNKEIWEEIVIPQVLANYSEKKRNELERQIQHSIVVGFDYYYYTKDYWLHSWGNLMPWHYNDDGEYSYHKYNNNKQWYDYSAGLIYGYKFDKQLGCFVEGKYNKYWNREWYDFKFGVNYVIF